MQWRIYGWGGQPPRFFEKSLQDHVNLKLKTLQYLQYIRIHIFCTVNVNKTKSKLHLKLKLFHWLKNFLEKKLSLPLT